MKKIISIVCCIIICLSTGYSIKGEDVMDYSSNGDNYLTYIDENGAVKNEQVQTNDIIHKLKIDENKPFEVRDNGKVIAEAKSFDEASKLFNKKMYQRSTKSNIGIYNNGYLRSSNEDVIVNFNIKSGTTDYTEDKTNRAGYLFGGYAADGAYLETSKDGKRVKFKMAGVTGWVNIDEVELVPLKNTKSTSYYIVKNGLLYHYYTPDINQNKYYSTLVGYKQSYMKENQKYFSYDGHYFYLSFTNMINDYKNGRTTSSINSQQPYYNYYQYLPHRSKSTYDSGDFNNKINDVIGSSASKMKNMGNSFIEKQNTYGVNSLLAFGVAVNESAWGRSEIAMKKNNLFGHGAVDSNPYYGANGYESPDFSILYHDKIFISEGYANPLDWRYFGSHLGDKQSGMNVKYASDPYWGEKAASQGYYLNRSSSKKDYNKYTLGILTDGANAFIYKDTNLNSTKLYSTGNGSSGTYNFPFIILGEVTGEKVNGSTTWYKIQSDAPLTKNRTGLAKKEQLYEFANDFGYVHSSVLTKVNKGFDSQTADGFTVKVFSFINESEALKSQSKIKEKLGLTTEVYKTGEKGLGYQIVSGGFEGKSDAVNAQTKFNQITGLASKITLVNKIIGDKEPVYHIETGGFKGIDEAEKAVNLIQKEFGWYVYYKESEKEKGVYHIITGGFIGNDAEKARKEMYDKTGWYLGVYDSHYSDSKVTEIYNISTNDYIDINTAVQLRDKVVNTTGWWMGLSSEKCDLYGLKTITKYNEADAIYWSNKIKNELGLWNQIYND